MSFILNELNDFKPSDESLKQGRNRSCQAVLTLNTLNVEFSSL